VAAIITSQQMLFFQARNYFALKTIFGWGFAFGGSILDAFGVSISPPFASRSANLATFGGEIGVYPPLFLAIHHWL